MPPKLPNRQHKNLLITMLRITMFNKNNHKYKFQTFHKTMKRFYNLKQERSISNVDYLKKVENIWEVVKTAGG